MAFMSIAEAKKYKTAYSPKFKVFVELEDTWKSGNGQTIFLCSSDSPLGFNGEHVKKMFMQTELTEFCLRSKTKDK